MRRPYNGDLPITSEYGNREFWMNGKLVSDFHNGIDIGGVFDVLSPANGTVEYVVTNGRIDDNPNINTPANYVLINHGGGIKTLHLHLSRVEVGVGRTVMEGEKIGVSGRTGYATGDHLHFGVQVNGVYVNPRSYVDFGGGVDEPVVDGDFITVQSGWGLSHVAVAAGLPANEDTYNLIYNLNQGWRGSWDWRSLNARMGAGDKLRVREVKPTEEPKPEPEVKPITYGIYINNTLIDKIYEVESEARNAYEAHKTKLMGGDEITLIDSNNVILISYRKEKEMDNSLTVETLSKRLQDSMSYAVPVQLATSAIGIIIAYQNQGMPTEVVFAYTTLIGIGLNLLYGAARFLASKYIKS